MLRKQDTGVAFYFTLVTKILLKIKKLKKIFYIRHNNKKEVTGLWLKKNMK